MEIAALLRGRLCDCGRRHTCPIQTIVIERGAIAQIYALTAGYSRILLVADRHTYDVCGKKAGLRLREKLWHTLVFSDDLLVPDETAVAKLTAAVSASVDLILGVGAGVIQDLCKYVSAQLGLPYYIVATAPSMDGYASPGAAMIAGNLKVTYDAHLPAGIVADIDILKDAPLAMIQAGYGDIIGKLSCLNDWRLSAAVNAEYFCPYVYDLTMEMTNRVRGDGALLAARDPDAIKRLTEALIGVGIAMAYVGNSRPASGSEHHLAHFFELTGLLRHTPYLMHGIDVAFSTVCTCRMREEIRRVAVPKQAHPFHRVAWEAAIRAVYGAAAEGVIALRTRAGTYTQNDAALYAEKWEAIQRILADAPSAAEIEADLNSVGLDMHDFERMYGRETIETAERYAKDLKDRYSVLWLYAFLFDRGRRKEEMMYDA